MRQYLDLLRHIRDHGVEKSDRTGTGTRSVFGYQMRFDLGDGFPMLTTKKLHLKSIVHELLWFLRGETNVQPLQAVGVKIWDEWARPDGELGPIYGYQWRSWPAPDGRHIDQIAQVVEGIRRNPDSRRLIVSAWNVADIPDMALAPCHVLFQFYVAGRAGSPASSTSGAPTCSWACPSTSRATPAHHDDRAGDRASRLGDFVHTLGDAHLYLNHLEQADLQLGAGPPAAARCSSSTPAVTRLEDFTFEDVKTGGVRAPSAHSGPGCGLGGWEEHAVFRVGRHYSCHALRHSALRQPDSPPLRPARGEPDRGHGGESGHRTRGGLPWRLPDDLRHFKELTVDHTVIMGRKTFEEIKRPLDNRRNVVITRNKEFRAHGVTVVPSLKEALALGATEDEVFVIGGGEIFAKALPLADRIYLTLVHAQVEGDTYFPPFEAGAWALSSEEFHPADERHQYAFTFRRYDRLTD